jgi:hypothetical protein
VSISVHLWLLTASSGWRNCSERARVFMTR